MVGHSGGQENVAGELGGELAGERRVVNRSGKRLHFGPLSVWGRVCQRAAQCNGIRARVPTPTSADVNFWGLSGGCVGRSEITMCRRMGRG